jgi:DNA-binding CsgD family transcriptional regulator
LSEDGVADRLGVDVHTAHAVLERVFAKLGVVSKVELVIQAVCGDRLT